MVQTPRPLNSWKVVGTSVVAVVDFGEEGEDRLIADQRDGDEEKVICVETCGNNKKQQLQQNAFRPTTS